MSEYNPTQAPQTISEVWRDVPGYEGLYQVSASGHVRRVEMVVTTKRGFTQTHRAKDKALGLRSGYFYLWLFKENHGRKWYVHELVALTFIGPRPAGYQVHHRNHDRLDNTVDNIEYTLTHAHMVHHSAGEEHNMAVLTEHDVIQARSMYPAMQVTDIARQMGKPYHAIWNAVRGKTWKHIT